MDITPILGAVITLVIAVLTCYAIPMVRAQATADQLVTIRTWARIAVNAAEQLYTGSGKGPEKKAYVIAFLKNKGFEIDENSLDVLIESAVLELKKAIGAE